MPRLACSSGGRVFVTKDLLTMDKYGRYSLNKDALNKAKLRFYRAVPLWFTRKAGEPQRYTELQSGNTILLDKLKKEFESLKVGKNRETKEWFSKYGELGIIDVDLLLTPEIEKILTEILPQFKELLRLVKKKSKDIGRMQTLNGELKEALAFLVDEQ